jgi:hypothetical protein
VIFARLGELAVLPKDEDVPLEVIAALWAETGGLDLDEADDLVRRFLSAMADAQAAGRSPGLSP